MRSKKAQLGFIELKFALIGLAVGLVIGIILIVLSSKGTLPSFIAGMAC